MTAPGTPAAERGEPPSLAGWAKTLQRRIRQRGTDFFILYGPGVRDIHPLGKRRHGTVRDFLGEVMLGDRAVIITYDRGAGIRFTDPQAQDDFRAVLKAYDQVAGTSVAQSQPRDPDRALQLIETYLYSQLTENRLPAGGAGPLGHTPRHASV